MIVAADYPRYLPSWRFFQKMANADLFLIADDLPFRMKLRINRTGIRSAEGRLWLTVPVLKKNLGTQNIREVRINPDCAWRQKHWKSLSIAYQLAAYFERYDLALEKVYRQEWTSLFELNITLIRLLREMLGITTPLKLFSEFSAAQRDEDRLLHCLQQAGASTYLCEENILPEQGKNRLESRGISVRTIELDSHPRWHQLFDPFIEELSLLDMLFNEGEGSRDLLLLPH